MKADAAEDAAIPLNETIGETPPGYLNPQILKSLQGDEAGGGGGVEAEKNVAIAAANPEGAPVADQVGFSVTADVWIL